MNYSNPTGNPKISEINANGWDADLVVPNGRKVEVTNGSCIGNIFKKVMLVYGGR